MQGGSEWSEDRRNVTATDRLASAEDGSITFATWVPPRLQRAGAGAVTIRGFSCVRTWPLSRAKGRVLAAAADSDRDRRTATLASEERINNPQQDALVPLHHLRDLGVCEQGAAKVQRLRHEVVGPGEANCSAGHIERDLGDGERAPTESKFPGKTRGDFRYRLSWFLP